MKHGGEGKSAEIRKRERERDGWGERRARNFLPQKSQDETNKKDGIKLANGKLMRGKNSILQNRKEKEKQKKKSAYHYYFHYPEKIPTHPRKDSISYTVYFADMCDCLVV